MSADTIISIHHRSNGTCISHFTRVEDAGRAAEFYDALGWRRAADNQAGFVKYDLVASP